MHPDPTHNGRVVGNPCLRAYFCLCVGHDHSIVKVMLMGIYVGVIRDGAAGMDHDFTAIVEQDVLMDYAVVFHRQVISKGDFDPVKDLYVLTDMFEDMAAKHGSHAISEPVVQANGRAIKHHPEPDQRLA